jgi:hypothetical protein
MVISPWSNPFFRPKKGRFADFLEAMNGEIGTNNTSLHLLPWRTPRWNTSRNGTNSDDGIPSWACPAVSPCSAGLACPVSLYGAKAIPPTREERGQEPTIRQRRHAAGSGPNYRRSRRCIRRQNPPPVAQTRALFKRPRRLRRLSDWAFPNPNHASPATDADDDNDGSISVFDMSHESRDDDDTASPIDQTREEQCPEWIDDTDDSSAISRHSCSLPTVPPRNAREKESHAVKKTPSHNVREFR